MEYIGGADLSRLEKHGAVPQGPALEIIGEVASALHVAYTTPGPSGEPLRLLHRDIKPQNIIVTPNGEVKVLDFSVARADYAGREAQTRHMLLGSLGYMAPERFEHKDGPGSDVYAMGVLLWEMLSGQQFGRISIKPDMFAQRRQEALDQLEKGGLVMAIRAQAPIVPVAIMGGKAAMQKGSAFVRPVRVTVRIGEAIETAGLSADDRDRIINEVRARIEELLRQGPA